MRQQYLAQAIRTILQGSGYVSIPVTQQNVIWMMQQIGAQMDEFNFVSQQMLCERQAYFAQAIASVLQRAGYTSIPVTEQNVMWMMQQIGAQMDEFNFVSQQMQAPVAEQSSVQKVANQQTRLKQKVHFGQDPDEPEGSVNMFSDREGVIFRFNAENFDPDTKVEAKIVNSKGRDVKLFDPVRVDSNRSIGHARLQWAPTPDVRSGEYTFVAKGKCKGKTKTLKEEFTFQR